jgi:hypothetical protein
MAIDAINNSDAERLEDLALGNGYYHPPALGNGPIGDVLANAPIGEIASNALSHGIQDMEASERVAQPLNGRVTAFPNLALAVMQTALKKEEADNIELQGHIATAQKLNKDVEKLIELTKRVNGKETDIFDSKHPEIAPLLQELNIELKEGTTVGKAKAHFDSLSTQKRSDLSTLMTTKIQVKTQQMQSIIDIVRDIQRKQDRLAELIQANMKG